jgi:DNA polymerase/3'-5' exonuclease PolX
MDLIIQDNLKMIYLMDRVNSTIDQIEWLIKVNGKTESHMEKGNKLSHKLVYIKESFKMDLKMVKEKWFGLMEDNMKVIFI